MRVFTARGVLPFLVSAAFAILPNIPSFALSRDRHLQKTLQVNALEAPEFPPHNLSVPVDHFHNETKYEPHSNASFDLRYWFDAQYYKPGGPVIVLAAGETSGKDRIPFLKTGIAHILAKATKGVAVILEHRYYGTSFPTPNVTVENLRFLSTEQALADTAYFASNVVFPGLEKTNLTAPDTPWIIYGGSYAGAFAALARKIYPEVFWGAISSSGVTAAIVDYWEYNEAARLFAPGQCATNTATVVDVVDRILLGGDKQRVDKLKTSFGLDGIDDTTFAEVIGGPLSGLQATNWDLSEEDGSFAAYCAVKNSNALLYSSVRHLQGWVDDFVTYAGYTLDKEQTVITVLNHIGFIRDWLKRVVGDSCSGKKASECFERYGGINHTEIPADHGWLRSWTYQTCTQWGYFHTGAGTPKDRMALYSRKVDLEWKTGACRDIFGIHSPPDIESINKHGGFGFSYPRVAIIDGAQDPWRAATPHRIGLEDRESTDEEPFLLIDPGVHHWDEYGIDDAHGQPDYPPRNIVQVQEEEIRFVKVWLKEFEKSKQQQGGEGRDNLPGEL